MLSLLLCMDNLHIVEDGEEYFEHLRDVLGLNELEIAILRKTHKEKSITS